MLHTVCDNISDGVIAFLEVELQVPNDAKYKVILYVETNVYSSIECWNFMELWNVNYSMA